MARLSNGCIIKISQVFNLFKFCLDPIRRIVARKWYFRMVTWRSVITMIICQRDVATSSRRNNDVTDYDWQGLSAHIHYSDDIMCAMASQINSLTVVYSTVYSGADQRKHQSSASLAFVRGIHRRPVNSPHKGPVTRKMFPFHDVIMKKEQSSRLWEIEAQSI